MDSGENKHSKVFVGGISIHTTDKKFKEAFEPYGEITDCIILRDPETNRSRGFGFVTFSSTHSVDEVLGARPIAIDDREVDVKRAIPKEANNPQAHARTNKVFIGGLPNDVTREELTDFFEKKGDIDEVELIHKDGVFRGFGFITFSDCDTADKVIVDGEYDLRRNKRFCRVSKAGTRGKQMPSYNPYPQGGGGGGGPYPGYSFTGHNPHSGAGFYGGGGGGDTSYYGSDFNGGYSAGPKSGYMGPPSGPAQYPAHGAAYIGSSYGGGHGGYTGGPPSGGYDSRSYNQAHPSSYSPAPTAYNEYTYGYGGHGGGGGGGGASGGSGSGYTGGSSSQYMSSYKGDSGRASASSGRAGRSRYKPY